MEQKRTILVVGGIRSGKTEFIEACKKICGVVFDDNTAYHMSYVEGRKETLYDLFKYKRSPDGIVVMFNWKNETHYAIDQTTSHTPYLDYWFKLIKERFGEKVPVALVGSHSSSAPTHKFYKNMLCDLVRLNPDFGKLSVLEVIGNKNAYAYEASYHSVESLEYKGISNVIKDLVL
jgi:hypothetical protein